MFILTESGHIMLLVWTCLLVFFTKRVNFHNLCCTSFPSAVSRKRMWFYKTMTAAGEGMAIVRAESSPSFLLLSSALTSLPSHHRISVRGCFKL